MLEPDVNDKSDPEDVEILECIDLAIKLLRGTVQCGGDATSGSVRQVRDECRAIHPSLLRPDEIRWYLSQDVARDVFRH